MKLGIDVALVGEDTTHAMLLGALLRSSIEAAAHAAGFEWIIENLWDEPALVGDVDLAHVLPGLRYTSSIASIERPRVNGKPVRLGRRFGGGAWGFEAVKWHDIVFTLRATSPPPEVLLIAKDTDNAPDRIIGLRQVAVHFREVDPRLRIVIAAPHRDAECWLVAGFEPATDRERDALDAVRRALSFNPLTSPERLTGQPNDAATDAKRVLRRLLCLDIASRPLTPDELRDHHPRLLSDLPRLRARGADSGLTAFLDALRADVVPCVVPGP